MFDFENALVSDIPLHEASAFFVGIKTASRRVEHKEIVIPEEVVKTASLRMKSAAQRVIEDLLAGKMPEGKAGYFKTASARMKLAFGEQMLPQDQPVQPPPAQAAPQQAAAPAAAPNPGTPSMAAAPKANTQMPTNYLGAELAAQQGQQQNEASFYRERMLKAVEENAQLQEQIAASQGELQQLQQQAAMSGTQIQLATQQAVQAQDSALQQSQLAAKMRMGMQQMRAQMLQIASQDPAAIAEQDALAAGAAAMGASGPGAPQAANTAGFAPEGAIGADPAAGGAAGGADPAAAGGAEAAPAEAGGEGESAPAKPEAKKPEPKGEKPPKHEINIKSAAVLEKARTLLKEHGKNVGAGAAVGAGLKLIKGQREDSLSDKVRKLENTKGTFGQSMRLSKAKSDVEEARAVKKHPVGAVAHGAAQGAVGGALLSKVVKKVTALK